MHWCNRSAISNVLFLAAFQFRLDRFLEPTLILGSVATSAELLRWAAVLDLFGFYLATAVLAYVLWRHLRPRNPLIADLSTMAAAGYALQAGWARPSLPWSHHVDVRLHRCHRRSSGIDGGAVRDRAAGGVACHLAIPGRHPSSSLVARNRVAPRPDHLRLSRLSLALAAAATVGAAANVAGLHLVRGVLSACSSRYGLRGGSRSSWCFAANRKQLPPLPCHDRQHAVVPLAATALFAVTLLWPRGNAAFLMVNVTLLGWIAALAARLATVHGHTDLKPPDQLAAT